MGGFLSHRPEPDQGRAYTRARPLLLALCALSLGAGCVSPATTLQTARPADPGQVTGTLGASVPVHGAFVDGTIDILRTSADRLGNADTEPLDAQETHDVVSGGLAALLFQPTLVTELSARVGLVENLDAGVRLTGSNLKLDAKYAFVRSEYWDVALSAGYVYHTGVGPSAVEVIYDVFETLALADYSRHDLDAALIASTSPRQALSFYMAARYVLALPDVQLRLPAGATLAGLTDYGTTEPLHIFGPTVGLRLGSEDVALLLELGVMYSLYEPPPVLDIPVDLGGLVVTPAVGLDARF